MSDPDQPPLPFDPPLARVAADESAGTPREISFDQLAAQLREEFDRRQRHVTPRRHADLRSP